MLSYLASTLIMALLSVTVYAYYHKRGQFDDPEEAKYQMLRDKPNKPPLD